jgi:hypothetical protein
MTEEHPSHEDNHGEESHTRTESWPCEAPAELDLSLDVGRIEVNLAADATTVEVRLRADQSAANWTKGVSGLLNWLGESTGPSGSIKIGGRDLGFGGGNFPFGGGFNIGDLRGLDLEAEAVQAVQIDWSESSRRLVAHSPTRTPLRIVPLTMTVRAPINSRLELRADAGRITVTGQSGEATVRAGSGDVELDTVHGDLELTTGSGAARVHAVSGEARIKTGSGNLSLDALEGPTVISAGSGEIHLGAVRADVQVKNGSGDLAIDDAERGVLTLTTGSGDLRVAVHAGVLAELDLSCGSGRAHSDLDLRQDEPAGGTTALHIHGETGNGDVLVTRALSTTGAAG